VTYVSGKGGAGPLLLGLINPGTECERKFSIVFSANESPSGLQLKPGDISNGLLRLTTRNLIRGNSTLNLFPRETALYIKNVTVSEEEGHLVM